MWLVSLLLSRLDRRKDADEVRLQLDVPTAMRELAILLDEWAAQTRKTNAAARGWVRGRNAAEAVSMALAPIAASTVLAPMAA
jgi:hypothetical protein